MENIKEKENQMAEENTEKITEETANDAAVSDAEVEQFDEEEAKADEELLRARKKLLSTVLSKVPTVARATVKESLVDLVDTLSKEDCTEMTKLLKEKGLMALMRQSKKKKKKLEKENADLTDGKV